MLTVKTDQTGWMLSLRWGHRSFCWFCHAAAHLYVNANFSGKKEAKEHERYKHVFETTKIGKFVFNSFKHVVILSSITYEFFCFFILLSIDGNHLPERV